MSEILSDDILVSVVNEWDRIRPEVISKDVSAEQLMAIAATALLLHELCHWRAAFAWLHPIGHIDAIRSGCGGWYAVRSCDFNGCKGPTPYEAIEALRAKVEVKP